MTRPSDSLAPPALPYAFSTASTGLIILKSMAALQAILLLGVLDAVFVSQSLWKLMGVLVCLVFVTGFGVIIFKKLAGGAGTITATDVTVAPSKFLFLTSDGPSGRFDLVSFKAVRVEIIKMSTRPNSGPHERVYLAGREGTPDILVAHTRRGAGIGWAGALGRLLRLPVEERAAPY
jgi:hypothetical protein